MTTLQAEKQDLSLLNQLLKSAGNDAAEAMSRWTNDTITLSLGEIREIKLEEVACKLNLTDEISTMIVHHLDGDLGGQLFLTFDEETGRRLASLLLRREFNPEGEWSKLDISALNETGNILSCAYMRAISEMINENLVPSPPYFIQDYGASVMEQAVLTQAVESNHAMVCPTIFKWENEIINWTTFFVPSNKLVEKLITSLQDED